MYVVSLVRHDTSRTSPGALMQDTSSSRCFVNAGGVKPVWVFQIFLAVKYFDLGHSAFFEKFDG
jgi:hypothetical protein